ncbi:DNA polymerase III subunit psi [Nissabacter sp. SGAir0207]|uniref:DNA polymerase III subunit psi n=1 Tax=Nissabacter sp. SGAir0207 TaxID=2126321 RepID=UPI0010CCD6F8|nr:DNA polymerase III subunit psi [Nissabacter sp. SGAir0207]QCR37258.1 DNA polymerase III subunit psi [Nissabacter sp. SGAir0207]
MATRRDILLQQLGITQWTLRRPAVLQGEIAVHLPDGTRLLLVAESPPPADHPLVRDLLRALELDAHQVYSLTPDQAAMLPEGTRCTSWRLGVSTPLALEGVQLSSPALPALSQDAGAKRALWQQICEHEQHLHPDAGRPSARHAD